MSSVIDHSTLVEFANPTLTLVNSRISGIPQQPVLKGCPVPSAFERRPLSEIPLWNPHTILWIHFGHHIHCYGDGKNEHCLPVVALIRYLSVGEGDRTRNLWESLWQWPRNQNIFCIGSSSKMQAGNKRICFLYLFRVKCIGVLFRSPCPALQSPSACRKRNTWPGEGGYWGAECSPSLHRMIPCWGSAAWIHNSVPTRAVNP